MAIFGKLSRGLRKNSPEIGAFLSGKMPSYIYGRTAFHDLPVFCSHAVEYTSFRHQLEFLSANGYRTLTGDELLERMTDPRYRNNGKDVVLTFDDGLKSLWTVGFTLLQQYECKVISFILPGLIDERSDVRQTIADVDDDSREEFIRSENSAQPFCNWREIEVMHDSGLVDFQSHGLFHRRVSTSPRIVDFIHPEAQSWYCADFDVPVYADGSRDNIRESVLGHPVYENDSRFGGQPRYRDSPDLRKACAEYVNSNGGDNFFKQRQWRNKLFDFVSMYRREHSGGEIRFENEEETRRAMWEELDSSKRLIEDHLPGKQVLHFCFPWFRASSLAAEMAKQAGYEAIHVGATAGFRIRRNVTYPLVVRRLQQEFLAALPGQGSEGLLSPWLRKARYATDGIKIARMRI